MIKYIGKKQVQAEPMNELQAVELGYARPNEDNHEWREGYHVEYEDGYHSWSPKNVFEAAYKVSETFIDRMVIELDELEERMNKLKPFLDSDKIKDLPHAAQVAIAGQYGAMLAYISFLEMRISIAKLV